MNKNLLLVFLLAPAACRSASATVDVAVPPAPEAQPGVVHLSSGSQPYVKTRAVSVDTSADTVRAPARVDFRDGGMARVGAPIAGRVVRVDVQVGDHVKAGDALVTLDSSDAAAARADLERARLTLAQTKDAAARQAVMLTQGVGVESEKLASDAALGEAQADFDRASRTVALLGEGTGSTVVLRAPISGNVLDRRVSIGESVEPGADPLVRIGDSTSLWVVADVFERDLAEIQPGASVKVDVSTVSGPISGKVVSVGTQLDGGMRTAPVYVALDQDVAGLRGGMFAHAAISTTPTAGVSVPATAVLIKEGGRHVVYVQTDALTFAARDVEVGHSQEGQIRVTGGLHGGDQVVVEGALLLDGAADQML